MPSGPPKHFLKVLRRIKPKMSEADERHKNREHASNHIKDLVEYLRFMGEGSVKENSMMRTLKDYLKTHTVLDYLSHSQLKGKRILHLAASTGVYARFLEEYCGAHAIAMDIDPVAAKEAKKRGTQNVVRANAIPKETMHGFAQAPSGLWLPQKRTNHLPFRSGSLDYAVSEHFLFANFHKEHHPPGFENERGSLQKSEEALKELNRVLKKGGRAIIVETHPSELPELQKYQKKFEIHGFEVEQALNRDLAPVKKGKAPYLMVLKKIKEAA